MAMPTDVGVIDLMLGIPSPDPKPSYDFMRPLFRDPESLRSFDFPVEYMFKDVPQTGRREDYIKYTLQQMDQYGIERALIGVGEGDGTSVEALRRHPDRFVPSCGVEEDRGDHLGYGRRSTRASRPSSERIRNSSTSLR